MEGISSKEQNKHEFDLPLSSNFFDVKVQHFVINLSCSFSSRTFKGSLTIFCNFNNGNIFCSDKEVVNPEIVAPITNSKGSDLIVLDCFALDVDSCMLYDLHKKDSHVCTGGTSIQIAQCCMENYLLKYESLEKCPIESINFLEFHVSKHYLKICLPNVYPNTSEVVIKINYKTFHDGPSLMWTKDQNLSPCVLTCGHQLNNRSLFPSQDMPQAMSTWHCSITLTDRGIHEPVVVMTGETPPTVTENQNGDPVFHFSSSYPMPSSTLAIAVGCWKFTDLTALCSTEHENTDKCMLSCHLYSPPSLHTQFVDQLSRYLPPCLKALKTVLGTYPLKHLSLVIVPECFDSLGMACPHLMFLSQSLLCEDLSMMYRVSHELCHTWFGILTGSRCWTEEWLTEGVCCYLEFIVHAMAMQWGEQEAKVRAELRALIKYRLLKAEMSNTPEHLQTLRPNESNTGIHSEVTDDAFVKNGLDPEKNVMQGFFLLSHLEHIAGKDLFLHTIKTFINQQLGQLFTSQELLQFIFDECPKLRLAGLTVDQTCRDWLDCPGMPEALSNFSVNESNNLIQQVYGQVSQLRARASHKRTRKQRSSSLKPTGALIEIQRELVADQCLLLLDLLVEDSRLPLTPAHMASLRRSLHVTEANAEVQHSWCELVVARRAVRWVRDVQVFLYRHQALGVYLYGELMISETPRLQQLARTCYSHLQDSMSEGTRTTVRSLLFPEDTSTRDQVIL
ncbi:aminopeptidase O-like isoform X2 [Physella acuta]|uniref:aminopeptidase O-like isoform X2 n=1 Tax=Physella acuta TaxID=109671 RepID=UPI0027DB5817|nr:aminopeptidase O-like isoform X2 [Physella acuta]